MSEINPEDINFLLGKIKDQAIRREITKHSHLLFFNIYMSHFVKCEMAPFHQDLFAITEDEGIRFAAITAFRESAKSTIMTLSYSLWSILGVQQKKFVVILSQTKDQASQHFKDLKHELETNSLLKADLGPFKEDEWNSRTVVIPRYNARITVASAEQSIRGMKHGPHRPQIIIADDCEDTLSVKTLESRDNTYNWFTKEILPLGSRDTKIIVIGNLLHEDSLLMRLKKGIASGTRSGIYREYPLINEDGQCLWPGLYPTQEAIEQKRLDIGNKFSWSQEFLLKPLDNKEAIVQENMLHYYRELPKDNDSSSYAVGIDLAISEKDGADFTAMVTAKVFKQDDGTSLIYILPNPVNEHLLFPDILARIDSLVAGFGGKFSTTLYIEEAMLQGYLTQYLDDHGFIAEGFKLHGMDKRIRVQLSSHPINSAKVFFPEVGAEPILYQLLNFGATKNDDLVDALTVLILKIMEKDSEPMPNITVIDGRIF